MDSDEQIIDNGDGSTTLKGPQGNWTYDNELLEQLGRQEPKPRTLLGIPIVESSLSNEPLSLELISLDEYRRLRGER